MHGRGPGCATAATNMTELWINLGGRGIDTALDYANQPEVGVAIKAAVAAGTVPNRSALFVTTKISPRDCTEVAALAAVKTMSSMDRALQRVSPGQLTNRKLERMMNVPPHLR